MNLTKRDLEMALVGYQNTLQKIHHQIADIRAELAGHKPESGKRKMSPEARARIAEAQRKRWARAKGQRRTAA